MISARDNSAHSERQACSKAAKPAPQILAPALVENRSIFLSAIALVSDTWRHVGDVSADLVVKLQAAQKRWEAHNKIKAWVRDLQHRIAYCSHVDFDDLWLELERSRLCIELAKERRHD